MALDRTTLKLAAQLDASFTRQIAEYDEYAATPQYNEFGQRLRTEFCEHGVSMWTDYDCACGACEMGYTYRDGVYRMGVALGEAKRRMRKLREMTAALETFRAAGMGDMLDYQRVGKALERLLHVA